MQKSKKDGTDEINARNLWDSPFKVGHVPDRGASRHAGHYSIALDCARFTFLTGN